MPEDIERHIFANHELALAEAPFRDSAIRAAAIPEQGLINYFNNRAVLASDIRALELSDDEQGELANKITTLVVNSTVYNELQIGTHRFCEDPVRTFDQYLSMWYHVKSPNELWDMFYDEDRFDAIDHDEETLYGKFVADYKIQLHSMHMSDFHKYVLQQLQDRDEYAVAALVKWENVRVTLAEKRDNDAILQETRKAHKQHPHNKTAMQRQDVRLSVSDYAIAYPSEKKAFDSVLSASIRSLPPNEPLLLQPGILSRAILGLTFKQAHYEFAAPMLESMLDDCNSLKFPWGSKFLATATKIQEKLVEGYQGKLSDLTATYIEPNEELLAKMFANRASAVPSMDKIRRVLWELTLLPTGKPPIMSAAESVIYIDTTAKSPTPTIIFTQNLHRCGKEEITQSRIDSIRLARTIESEALQNPVSAGLPSLGKR